MKVWAVLFNIFGVLVLGLMMIVAYNDILVNYKRFEDARIRYVIDYATEGAFMSSLEGGSLGITYEDLQNANINPSTVMNTFKTIFLLSYDMALSEENYDMLDRYIATALIAQADGFYIASIEEVDTDKTLKEGGEYKLKWGVKKPYMVQLGPDRYLSFNMSSQRNILVERFKTSGSYVMKQSETYADTLHYIMNTFVGAETKPVSYSGYPEFPFNDETKYELINKQISDEINYGLKARSEFFDIREEYMKFLYLPSTQTSSGVNSITKPTVLFVMSDLDILGIDSIDSMVVGGFTLDDKRRVIGFRDVSGNRMYCYDYQLPESMFDRAENFFNSMEDAVRAGYKPHIGYMLNN